MTYSYILEVFEEESGDKVCQVEAMTLESLEEQLRKVEHAQKKYEGEQEVRMQMEHDRQKEEE